MKQRARKTGVLSSPYRVVEPGEVFDYHEAMNWADPVDDDFELDPRPEPEQAPWPAPTKANKRGSKVTKAEPLEVI